MAVTQINLTPNGPTLSQIALGFMRLPEWQLRPSELLSVMEECLDMGITTMDHADIYGGYASEQLFGDALALAPHLRPKMQLVTKCGIMLVSPNRPENTRKHYNTSRAHIERSVENSLRQLQTDYVDVLLIHRPDPFMNIDETAVGLTSLVQSGKVRQVGVSNFTPTQFDLLQSRLDIPLVTNQIELSVLQMAALHDGTLDHCQMQRMAPMVWSPLAGGRMFWGEDAQAERVRVALQAVGEALGGVAMDEVALAWLFNHPARLIPVLGTGKMARIRTAVAATQYQLTREQWFALWEASAGHKVP